jgi:hypothetical protein
VAVVPKFLSLVFASSGAFRAPGVVLLLLCPPVFLPVPPVLLFFFGLVLSPFWVPFSFLSFFYFVVFSRCVFVVVFVF